jgi:thioesterase domain-containing protein
LEHLGRDTNLFDAGLTSVEVPGLLAALNEFFTRQLTMTEFFEHASIAGIGKAVVTPIPASETVFVIDGQAGSTPLFLVHPAGGMAFAYRRLAGLVPGYRLYGLNSPYFGRAAKGYSNMHEMAAMYSRAIAGYHTGEPALAGWSFGGEVAYEMAVQLERKGGRARCLVLIDTARSEEVGQDSDPAIRRQYFVRNGIDPTSEFARTMSVDMQSHDAISVQYKPAPLKRTRVVLLKASESSSIDSHNGWLPYCKAGLQVVRVVGAHDYLLNEWHVKDLSRGLLAALEDSA